MKNKFKCLIAFTLLSIGVTNAQVGIGTTTPNASSALDITSTNRGLLLPRVSLTSTLSPQPLTGFVEGMQVYNTATAGTSPTNVTPGIYIATTTQWIRQLYNITGSRGDIYVSGDSTSPTFLINDATVTSTKLAPSLKVGGGSPSSSSVALEVVGGDKGFVVSTTSSIANITNPVIGMMVYTTDQNCLRVFTASGWSNCLLAATGNPSTNSSGIVTSYAAGVNRSITPVYGRRVTGLNTSSQATVTTLGEYNILASSATLPGLIFTSVGNFSATGAQTISLTAVGAIDNAYAGTTHTFTSNTTPSFTFTLTVAAMTYTTGLGSTFNALYNGIVDNVYTGTITTTVHRNGDTFNNNVQCNTKTISQTAPAACTGSVIGVSGTSYPVVWINGQCWLAKNLNEVPSAFSSLTPTSWIAPKSDLIDSGYWGYYNTTTTNGTAGWGVSEPSNVLGNEGLLYQWSAAMNNSIIERAQGACPTGYHVPSDCEWMYLEHSLGMSVAEQQQTDVQPRSSGSVGMKLKIQGTASNNVSGFAGLNSGTRGNSSMFINRNLAESYASSSKLTSYNYLYRYTLGGQSGVIRSIGSTNAVSVRCLKN